MRWLYSFLFQAMLPFILVRLWWRGRRAPAYRRRWRERFGVFSRPSFAARGRQSIWIHAVSVGETIAAAPMIRALQRRYPDLMVVVTTTTPTGSERVRALFGDSVFHVYSPYDTPGCVGRFLDRTQPVGVVIVETELWPNLVHGCHRRGIPVVVANARLSARSARGYGKVSALTRRMLAEVAAVVAQNPVDGERFVALGLPPSRLTISGSIKFDIMLDRTLRDRAAELRQALGTRLVWIAASTHAGEDEVILAAHRRLLERHPNALLLLVPRHPERFDGVADLIAREGLRYQRRSQREQPASDSKVILGDTMGELLLLFGAADVAFVGGSLVERGGHNMLEPAAWGLPVLTGPSDFNFREISQLLTEAGALRQIDSAPALAGQLGMLAEDRGERNRRGTQALAVIDANRGALARLLEVIDRELIQFDGS